MEKAIEFFKIQNILNDRNTEVLENNLPAVYVSAVESSLEETFFGSWGGWKGVEVQQHFPQINVSLCHLGSTNQCYFSG